MAGQDRFIDASDVYRVEKEWGEEQWIVNKEYCGKKLLIKKDRRSSVHAHIEKDEVIYLDSGRVMFEIDGASRELGPGDAVHVPPGSRHRFTALEDSVMIEFSTTHREADVVRGEPSGHVDPDTYDRQRNTVDALSGVSVLVVGDAMLDTYLRGSVVRVSAEAPVPVVRLESTQSAPGGAANAARSLAALGARTHFIGVCGDDESGRALSGLLGAAGVDTHLERDASRPTTVKTRVVAATGQQIVRFDEESDAPLVPDAEAALIDHIRSAAGSCDAVLVSDYAKGVCSPAVFRACIDAAGGRGVPVVVAPKPKSPDYLSALDGISLLVANRAEARVLTGAEEGCGGEPMARALSGRLDAPVVVTLGAEGMVMCEAGTVSDLPALARHAVDVSGAGDTCAAVMSAALAAGASVSDAADLANRAAAVSVSIEGTAAVSRDELAQML